MEVDDGFVGSPVTVELLLLDVFQSSFGLTARERERERERERFSTILQLLKDHNYCIPDYLDDCFKMLWFASLLVKPHGSLHLNPGPVTRSCHELQHRTTGIASLLHCVNNEQDTLMGRSGLARFSYTASCMEEVWQCQMDVSNRSFWFQ